MTKMQIKRALQRGLGRGILAVREEPERYRELVLWACGRDLSFDAECEGTRAWYDYRLISCFSDRTEFRELIERRLRDKKPDAGWDFAHFSELLMYFAADGDQSAEAALWEKYAELLRRLRGFRRASRPQRYAIECFETVCTALSREEESYSRIAADIGSLFLAGGPYDAWDFAWLYDSRPRGVNAGLRRRSASSRELSAYFAAFDDLKRARETRAAELPERHVPAGGRPLSVYLKRTAPELVPSYAEKYLAAAEPEARAAALEAFAVCPYPLDPAPVLADAGSDCPALRAAAAEALAELREPRVRRFALAHMEESPGEMLPILIKNYMPEDEALLIRLIRGLRIDYACKTGWHGIHLALLELFGPGSGVEKPPKALLPILYEASLCSCCRERVVRYMSKYRRIPASMWEELRYDSNDGIRSFAEAHFRRIDLRRRKGAGMA